ncbi:MAG: aromatic ring hydroxylase [Sphingomonadales bacterium]|nr:aromatic ring hydroxylase [Sphingomonadales bacterium]
MGARTGAELLAGMKGPREVWLGNDRVEDVTQHPALTGTAHKLAAFFDLQHEAAEDCLFPDPETGELINVSHMIPGSKEDIKRRHRGIRQVAEKSIGVLGRTPDYKNVAFAGFAGCTHEWGAYGNEAGAERMVNYQKHLRRNDVLLTHTLVNASTDRSKGDGLTPDGDVALHKVCDTEHGIIVSGARLLATLGPFADEIAVYPSAPLPPNTPEKYVLSFCLPVSTPGLKFLCRDSYASGPNQFDYPLSSRFDEQDAFVIFDNVEVPRDRLFIDGNLAVYNSVTRESWRANVMQQTSIRAQTKLEFAWGLASAMMESIGDKSPYSQQKLGEIWSYAAITRAALTAAEEGAREWAPGSGVWFCDPDPFWSLTPLMTEWMPRVGQLIRELGSHNLLAAPSWHMFQQPSLRPAIDKYLEGAEGTNAERRARLFRLAWDFVGSGLASRGDLYERFYLGSGGRAYQSIQRRSDRTRANRLVEQFLSEPVFPAEAVAPLAKAS